MRASKQAERYLQKALYAQHRRDQQASGCAQVLIGLLGMLGACYVIWQILTGNL